MFSLSDANDLLTSGVELQEAGRHEELVDALRPLACEIPLDAASPLGRKAWPALWMLGGALLELGRVAEATEVFDRWRRLTRVSEDPERPPTAVDKIICGLYGKAVTTAMKERRWLHAVRLVDSLAELAGDGQDGTAFQTSLMANLVNAKAEALVMLGSSAAAERLFARNIGRLRIAGDPRLRQPLARAMYRRASLLAAAGRLCEALAINVEIGESFANVSSPTIQEIVVDAAQARSELSQRLASQENEASAWSQRERDEQALVALDELIGRLGARPDQPVGVELAGALADRLGTLRALGRYEQAVDAAGEALALLGTPTSPVIRQCAASCLAHKAEALAALGRSGEVLATWTELLDRFRDDERPQTREIVRFAQVRRASLLALSGDLREVAAAGQSLVEAAVDEDDPRLALGLGLKGAVLADQGRYVAAIELFDQVIDRYRESEDEEIQSQVIFAIANKAVAEGMSGHQGQAARTREGLSRDFGDAALGAFATLAHMARGFSGGASNLALATALTNRALILTDLGRLGEAREQFAELVLQLGDSEEPGVALMVAQAREASKKLAADD